VVLPTVIGYEQLTEESEIDGIKLKEYNQYVEKNQNFFISNFIKFSKFRSKFSFNIPAMVFPEYYFFYRKMNLYGIIFFVIRLALYVPNLVASLIDGYWASTIFSGLVSANISISNLEKILVLTGPVNYIVMFISAFFTNWLYFKKAKNEITEISREDINQVEKTDKIKAKGGVSKHNLIVSILLFHLLAFASIALINNL